MASSTLNRKAMSSSHHSSYSSTSASNLDNNLDALLDDLQTSISPNKNDTLPRSHHYQQQQQQQLQQQQHKQQQYQTSSRTVDRSNSLSRKSPMRSASPAMRSMSPSQSSGGSRARTIEKYVSTGPAGTPSGIPGLEMLDEELKDVQPGQSKTVAYKQVSYHYDKQQEGQNLESWSKSDKQFSRNDASIADDFSQRTFERSSSRSRDSPDFARNQQHQNKEIIYKADVSTKTIPAPLHRTASESRQTERDFKYLKETSARTEPSPALSRKNLHKSEQQATSEELRNVEYLPPNLAPGPNTKVTTTIKTYTYELPGAPENYLPPSSTTTSVTKNVNVDKAVSYTVPKSQEQSSTSEKAVRYHVEEQRYVPPAAVPAQQQSTSEKSVKYHVEEQRYVPPVASPQLGNNSEKAMRYQQVEEQRFVSPPVVSSQQSSKEQKIMKSYHVEEQRYVPPPSQHSTTSEKAVRYHVEEQRYVPPSTPVMQHSSSSNTSERRYHLEEQTSPRYVAASPTPVNKSSHHEEKMFVERRGYRQASPQPLSQQSTLNRSERYVQQSRDYPDHASSQRQERVVYQAERAASPVQSSLHNSSKHFEEQHYSTSSRPPKPAANYESSNNAHFYKYDEQIIGTRPFPTSERPASPRQQPPRRIEDLMASFDSEEMHHQQQQHHQEVVEKRETFHSKNGHITKEVEYIKHSPSNGTSTMRSSSKSVAGPPVYYPPGSAEFAKKEEAMARNGSEWTKEKAAYEHGSAENTKKKEKSKKKVVPVCLPLCCALPCVIM